MQLQRPLLLFVLLALLCLMSPCPASADSLAVGSGDLIAEQFDKLNMEDLNVFINKIDQDLQEQLSGISLTKMLGDIRRGELDLDLTGIFKELIRYFCREFFTHTVLLGKLIILGAVLAILEHLQSAFEQNTVAKLAHSVGLLSLLTVALS